MNEAVLKQIAEQLKRIADLMEREEKRNVISKKDEIKEALRKTLKGDKK